MDWFVKAFLKASLAWLAAGVSLGVAMAVHPVWTVYRPAHLHMNLLGFVAMMIFGVAYHVIPRFTGHPIHNRRLAGAQWWLANIGLLMFVVGFLLLPNLAAPVAARAILAIGGMLSGSAAYVFAYNIWRTIDGPTVRRSVNAAAESAPASTTALRRRNAS